LLVLGDLYQVHSHLDQAMLSYEQAHAIFEERGDRDQGMVLSKMGDLAGGSVSLPRQSHSTRAVWRFSSSSTTATGRTGRW
jgi:hypothetical protein